MNPTPPSAFCRDCGELLSAFLHNELPARKTALVRRHLSHCPACREKAREMAETLEVLRTALSADKPPLQLLPDQRARILKTKKAVFRSLAFPTHQLVSTAAILLFVLLSGTMLFPFLSVSRKRASLGLDLMPGAALTDFSGRGDTKDTGGAVPDNPWANDTYSPRSLEHAVKVQPRDPIPSGTRGALGVGRIALPKADAPAESLHAPDVMATEDPRTDVQTPLVMRGLFAGRGAGGRLREKEAQSGEREEKSELSRSAAPASRPNAPSPVSQPAPVSSRERQEMDGRVGMDSESKLKAQSDDSQPAARPAPKPVTLHPFVDTRESAFSTFAMDVDTASYALTRRALDRGARPPPSQVRIEEFLNAFEYEYSPPVGPVFAIHADSAPGPFRPHFDLLRIGIKARRLGREQNRASVLTLVIDGSGSMNQPDRIGRLRQALLEMLEKLSPDDQVAIVRFDDRARLELAHTPVARKEDIIRALEAIAPSGPTNLEVGLRTGYELAARGFRAGASNRVLLLTDGVANVGESSAESLLRSVEDYRRQGILLSVFGLGSGSYDDDFLKTLSMKGDGVYQFLDSDEEARRHLVTDLAATLHAVALDAKIQVEFNPRRIRRWRQIGYERRALTREQFRDDKVDAGEVGSGQSVTALYEVEWIDAPREPLGTVRIRYQDVETGRIEEHSRRITESDRQVSFDAAPPRYRLAVLAAEFAEQLRGSPYTAGVSLREVGDAARKLSMELSVDPGVRDFVRRILQAEQLPSAER
ncbi:MAG: von Willebrand factor type A domain-containing protein [Kiritimatiellia bacterium]|nr:von Willebrand factor type A domain-containing protein [Kiritimatiellia bacterium]